MMKMFGSLMGGVMDNNPVSGNVATTEENEVLEESEVPEDVETTHDDIKPLVPDEQENVSSDLF